MDEQRTIYATASGDYPGIWDPEGRPWEDNSYKRRCEDALKILLLCQHHIHAPAGYFFDNLSLIELLHEKRPAGNGSSDEWNAFKNVVNDALIIGTTLEEYSLARMNTINHWDSMVEEWFGNTRGGAEVYANCVADTYYSWFVPETGGVPTRRHFELSWAEYTKERFGPFRSHLALLSEISPRAYVKAGRRPDFAGAMRERLALWQGAVPVEEREAADKLGRLLVACEERTGPAFSRSLYRNPTRTRALFGEEIFGSVPPAHNSWATLVARHAHQKAMAEMLQLEGVFLDRVAISADSDVTGPSPSPDIVDASRSAFEAHKNTVPVLPDLGMISYQQIEAVRRADWFRESVNRFEMPDDFDRAWKDHMRRAMRTASWQPVKRPLSWDEFLKDLRVILESRSGDPVAIMKAVIKLLSFPRRLQKSASGIRNGVMAEWQLRVLRSTPSWNETPEGGGLRQRPTR